MRCCRFHIPGQRVLLRSGEIYQKKGFSLVKGDEKVCACSHENCEMSICLSSTYIRVIRGHKI